MQHQQLLGELRETYTLIVNDPYHIQIQAIEGKHSIWLKQSGEIKFLPYGQQMARVVSVSQLKAELAKYNYADTDLALMQSLSSVVKKTDGKTGIFCDAGFADGHARVAILRAKAGDYDIAVRQIQIGTNIHAEDWAIKEAIRLYPGDEPVFSDCEPAVKMNQPRAQWIPRKANREADHFGNMRKKGKKL